MLANYFKTAIDLQITSAEHDALVKVLGMLEREEFTYGDAATGPKTFNMNIIFSESRCGTVACIGGWAAILMGRDPNDYMQGGHRGRFPKELIELFWPGESGRFATLSQAAIAMRSYLTTGQPNWDDALAE